MAFCRPQSEQRQVAVEPACTALLFVDVQNFNCVLPCGGPASGGGAGRDSKKLYIEYAKPAWETEQEFKLPNGHTWVEVAVKGDPGLTERGLVFCRLCRHHNKPNVFGKGYRWGQG